MATVMRVFVMALLRSLQRLLTRGQWRWTKPNALKCFRGRWRRRTWGVSPGPPGSSERGRQSAGLLSCKSVVELAVGAGAAIMRREQPGAMIRLGDVGDM